MLVGAVDAEIEFVGSLVTSFSFDSSHRIRRPVRLATAVGTSECRRREVGQPVSEDVHASRRSEQHMQTGLVRIA